MQSITSRGVTVRILTNSAATNDVVAAHAGYADTREELLNAGAELYELRPDSSIRRELDLVAGRSRAALHSKAMVFDRESAFIGSFNLDPRSRFINTEIGIMIDSPEIARQLGEFIDEESRPAAPTASRLSDDGDLVWTAETNGTKSEFDTDPETGAWQRFVIDVVGLLPIEEQL